MKKLFLTQFYDNEVSNVTFQRHRCSPQYYYTFFVVCRKIKVLVKKVLDCKFLTLLTSALKKYPFDKTIFCGVVLLKMRSTFLKNKFEGVYFCIIFSCRPQMFSIVLPQLFSESSSLQLILSLLFFAEAATGGVL